MDNLYLFCDEGPFQDDPSFFVSLVLFGRVLVDPAQLGQAEFARDVPDDVSARQHDAIFFFAKNLKID